VVHINAGIAALVGALILGKRQGYGKEPMPPHSLTLTLVGAGLLWVGWFGFNAGSNLESNGYASLAMINTFVATAAAGLSWIVVEWVTKKKPSALGLASGVVAGLVAVTPAAGFAGPMGAVILGLVVSPICIFFCSVVKNALKYDDSLDAFGIHGIGGIVGALGTGLLVNPAWGGAGIVDYTTCAKDGDISTCDALASTAGRPGDHPGEGRRRDHRLVGDRLGHRLLRDQAGHRPEGFAGSRGRRPGHLRTRRTRLPQLRLGRFDPGSDREGAEASASALFFWAERGNARR
jgi:hypothetical protein